MYVYPAYGNPGVHFRFSPPSANSLTVYGFSLPFPLFSLPFFFDSLLYRRTSHAVVAQVSFIQYEKVTGKNVQWFDSVYHIVTCFRLYFVYAATEIFLLSTQSHAIRILRYSNELKKYFCQNAFACIWPNFSYERRVTKTFVLLSIIFDRFIFENSPRRRTHLTW